MKSLFRQLVVLVFLSGALWAQNPMLRDLSCSDAGANDTYACNLPVTLSGYVTGQTYMVKANTANTGAASVNFSSLGAVTIKKVAGGITTDLADNDIRAGQWVRMIYDGTNMQMQSMLGNAVPAGVGLGDALTTNPLSQFAATTSAQLAGVLSDESGTGVAAFTVSPVFTTPNIGAATGSITGNAGTATALAANGANCSAGQAAAGVTAAGVAEGCFAPGDALVANPLSQFASTTSAQLAGVISNETGSGVLVFATSPTLVTPVLGVATGTSLALGGGTALTTTNQTGTGSLVLASSPTLVTPALGAATATSLSIAGGTTLTTTNQTGTGSLVLAASPTITGVATFDNGTAAAPSIVVRGTAYGISSPASTTLGLSVGSSSDLIDFNVGSSPVFRWTLNSSGGLVQGRMVNANHYLSLGGNTSTGTTNPSMLFANAQSMTATSGTQYHVENRGTFAPTSGTANFGASMVTPTINQTGGANGTIDVIGAFPVNTALVGTENCFSGGTTSAAGPGGTLTRNFTVTCAGAVTGGTYNKVTVTAPASASTLTIANGKTLTASNTLTLIGTDGASLSSGANIVTAGSAVFCLPILACAQGAASTTVAAASANQVHLWKFVLPFRATIREINYRVSVLDSGKFASVGIYDSTCATLLVDSGPISTTSVAFIHTAITPVTLDPGDYWYASTADTTTATTMASTYDTSTAQLVGTTGSSGTYIANGANASVAGQLPSACGALTKFTGTQAIVLSAFLP